MKRICIHFDINKTIILSDASSDRGFLASVQSLLSECSWGFFRLDKTIDCRTIHDWIPFTSLSPCASPPQHDSIKHYQGFDNDLCGIATFGNFVEDHIILNKKDQKLVKTHFTTTPKNEQDLFIGIGKGIYMREQGHYQMLLDKLKFNAQDEKKIEEWWKHQKGSNNYLSSGYYHLLPSFIHALRFLASKAKEGHDVRIIFRSFGVDIANVANELNSFCEGSHPLFSCDTPLNGTDACGLDFRLTLPENSGSFLRTGKTVNDIHLAHLNHDKV